MEGGTLEVFRLTVYHRYNSPKCPASARLRTVKETMQNYFGISVKGLCSTPFASNVEFHLSP